MDKSEAIKLSKAYLQRVKSADIAISEAWLFGSYANGSQHENSDIDIAIVLTDHGTHSFETEVKLMVIRKDDETMIEPHAFTSDEFDRHQPIVDQIVRYGEKIVV